MSLLSLQFPCIQSFEPCNHISFSPINSSKFIKMFIDSSRFPLYASHLLYVEIEVYLFVYSSRISTHASELFYYWFNFSFIILYHNILYSSSLFICHSLYYHLSGLSIFSRFLNVNGLIWFSILSNFSLRTFICVFVKLFCWIMVWILNVLASVRIICS
jgi:hypothetical protein